MLQQAVSESKTHPAHNTPGLARRLWLPLILLCAVGPALWIDLPVAHFCLDRINGSETRLPLQLQKLIRLSEVFSHGIGVLMIALAVIALDRGRRRTLLRVIVSCGFVSGIVAALAKHLVARARPYDFEFCGTVWTTFGDWLPFLSGQGNGMNMQSLPSAHTATAAGLAVGLSWLYPHGRWFFFLMAVLAAGQRVELGAHFVSDTLAGAAIGTTVALLCTRGRVVGGWFDRFEAIGEHS